MIIYVVKEGDTIASIAEQYGLPAERLISLNEIDESIPLVVGQTIVVLLPDTVHQVIEGDTIYGIADQYDVSVAKLYQNNPNLILDSELYVGESIVISYQGEPIGTISVNGYAYPFIDRTVLRKTLPYLTYLTVFSYGFNLEGELTTVDDQELINLALDFGVAPIMLLSTLTSEGTFSNELATQLLANEELQNTLINNILATIVEKGYQGLDIDFEYIYPSDREAYGKFIQKVTEALNAQGYIVITALAPKTYGEQPGLLYEAHDYGLLGAASNYVLLMTYEWGYTFGPPMAVSPINKVREVLDYAVTEVEPYKIFMGMPNYGYDWPLPYERGVTSAKSLGNVAAVTLAATNRVSINYDEESQAPYFYYTAEDGAAHVVWFEDARSVDAKARLAAEYDFNGISYWNIMKFFPQNWLVINGLYNIRKVV